jgi:putative ABC transport system ATP-binding protein
VLRIQNLRKTFHPATPNEVRALCGVDLMVQEGAFVVVIGTNGSGKSTLLNAVAGVFMPDTGRIELAGTDVTRGSNISAPTSSDGLPEPLHRNVSSPDDRREFGLAAARRFRGLG